MTTLPYRIEAEINCEFATVTVQEPATSSKRRWDNDVAETDRHRPERRWKKLPALVLGE